MRLIIFLLGLVIGGYAMHVYDVREFGAGGYAAEGGPVHDDWSNRIEEWHLSPDDIRADLARTGEVVRHNTRVAGEAIGDAAIVSEIKAKYLLDKDLSARDIHVYCDDGNVTLTGTVASPDLIAKAVGQALDTSGVRNVTAKLGTR